MIIKGHLCCKKNFLRRWRSLYFIKRCKLINIKTHLRLLVDVISLHVCVLYTRISTHMSVHSCGRVFPHVCPCTSYTCVLPRVCALFYMCIATHLCPCTPVQVYFHTCVRAVLCARAFLHHIPNVPTM